MEKEEKIRLRSLIRRGENEIDIIKKLEEVDIEIDLNGGTPLVHAVNYQKQEVVKYLIERGANVNVTQGDYSPLISACERNNLDIAKLLIGAGSDIFFKDSFGNSALWKATFNENIELVKLLLENGASPLEKDNNGETYYASAKRMGLESVIDIFDNYKRE